MANRPSPPRASRRAPRPRSPQPSAALRRHAWKAIGSHRLPSSCPGRRGRCRASASWRIFSGKTPACSNPNGASVAGGSSRARDPGDYAATVLADLLEEGLGVVLVGTSVADESARRRHYYADPRNRFWDLLDATGLTHGAALRSERDHEVTSHGVGLTDVVKDRAASLDRQLSDDDYDISGLLRRIARYRPCVVAFNGKEAAKRVARYLGHPVPVEGPLEWKSGGPSRTACRRVPARTRAVVTSASST